MQVESMSIKNICSEWGIFPPNKSNFLAQVFSNFCRDIILPDIYIFFNYKKYELLFIYFFTFNLFTRYTLIFHSNRCIYWHIKSIENTVSVIIMYEELYNIVNSFKPIHHNLWIFIRSVLKIMLATWFLLINNVFFQTN